MSTPLDVGVLTQLETDTGDPEFVTETVRVYLSELGAAREAVRAGARAGDLRALRAVAHRWGSASGLLGARDVETACRSLERVDPDVGPAVELLVAAWDTACDQVEAAMTRWLLGRTPGP